MDVTVPNETHLSGLTDPFQKNKITAIFVHTHQSMFDSEVWYNRGSVSFKNGNTTGEQKFEGTSFDDVVHQMRDFLASLD